MRWEDEKMMDKLKPCPFCGGEGVMDRKGISSTSHEEIEQLKKEDKKF
jgi:hypothetical protein